VAQLTLAECRARAKGDASGGEQANVEAWEGKAAKREADEQQARRAYEDRVSEANAAQLLYYHSPQGMRALWTFPPPAPS
jgi:hypothetical protein